MIELEEQVNQLINQFCLRLKISMSSSLVSAEVRLS